MSRQRNLVIVRSVRDQGMSVAQSARKFNVSRQWVYTLLARYDTHGAAGLEPGSRAPHTRPGTTPAAVRERIIALRRELTTAGADAGPITIAWHLEREGVHRPSTSTIRRVLHEAGMITPEPRKRPRSSYIRFEADLPNGCWQADITHTRLSDDTLVEILDFLDDHSRYLLAIQARASFTGPMVVQTMNTLITAHGAPAASLTDNGLVFTARLAGRRGGRNGYEKLLEAHGIEQKNGAPGHPQTQGKIERFHQTLKRWLAARPRARSLTELNEQLQVFRHWYNHERPHRARGGKTPAQAYEALPKATPSTQTAIEHRTRTDRIDKNGKLSLRYAGRLRHLGVGRAHVGRPVLMLIHGPHVSVSDSATGELLGEYVINPARDYQPRLP